MSMLDIAVDSFGQTIQVYLTQDGAVFDASSFTAVKYIFKPPGGEATEKVAGFDSDGSDGLCTYVTLDGLLSTAGEWTLWVKITKTGVSLTSVETTFDVAHTY